MTELFDLDVLNNHLPVVPAPKSIVAGEVVQKSDRGYFVSLGGKHDYFVPETVAGNLQEGETYPFYVVSVDPEDESKVELAFDRAVVWENMTTALESGEPVHGRVCGVARSRMKKICGLHVSFDSGVRGFIPKSELSHRGDITELLNREIAVVVLAVDPEKNDLVLSEKKATVQMFQKDDIIDGEVVQIVDFGAFVDIGPMRALLHVSDQVTGETLQIGESYRLRIIKVDVERGRVSLSRRNLPKDQELN